MLATSSVDAVTGESVADEAAQDLALLACCLIGAGRIARGCGLATALASSLGVSTSDNDDEAGAKRGIRAVRAGTFIRKSVGMVAGSAFNDAADSLVTNVDDLARRGGLTGSEALRSLSLSSSSLTCKNSFKSVSKGLERPCTALFAFKL